MLGMNRRCNVVLLQGGCLVCVDCRFLEVDGGAPFY